MQRLLIVALLIATAKGFVSSKASPFQAHSFIVEAGTPEERITNGTSAADAQFPYQVGLNFSSAQNGSWWCGGSVISESWILTAGHCIYRAAQVDIYLGATLRTSPKVLQTISSEHFIQHENYKHVILRNDIALIKMHPISFNNFINKIQLPKIDSPYSNYTGLYAIASGWGLEKDGADDVALHLNYARLKVISNEECTKGYIYGPLTVTGRTICTATPSGTSTCQGDSGGPLVLIGQNVQIGVTSFVSFAGCQSGAHAGFVRITYYLDWIKFHTGIFN